VVQSNIVGRKDLVVGTSSSQQFHLSPNYFGLCVSSVRCISLLMKMASADAYSAIALIWAAVASRLKVSGKWPLAEKIVPLFYLIFWCRPIVLCRPVVLE